MAKPNKLEPGDRVAYAAKFLKNIGAFTGDTPRRRGTFVKYWDKDPNFARVRWDDFDSRRTELAKQYGDDYVADAAEHGQCVNTANIAKVGSPRFALNDM